DQTRYPILGPTTTRVAIQGSAAETGLYARFHLLWQSHSGNQGFVDADGSVSGSTPQLPQSHRTPTRAACQFWSPSKSRLRTDCPLSRPRITRIARMISTLSVAKPS